MNEQKHKYADLKCNFCKKIHSYQLDNKRANIWSQVFICKNENCGAMILKTITKENGKIVHIKDI